MTLSRLALLVAISIAAAFPVATPASAQDQGVIVTVNDFPVTRYDIDQRIRMLQILGNDLKPTPQTRRLVLRAMVDEVIQIAEAKRFKANPTEREINQQIERLAKNLKTDYRGLEAKLGKQGLTIAALRHYVTAQISFNRILIGKYKVSFKVSDADIDAKYDSIKRDLEARVAQFMKDPRMKPVLVYQLLQIDLPVENAQDTMLLQARAVEANQFISRFKGCKSARAAASGIFNVKFGKTIDADASKMPPQIRKALESAGPGKAVGPARGPNGIQIIAFCSKRTISPPKPKYQMPTRQQVANAASNEKFEIVSEKYMKDMRKRAFVDYKDPSYRLTD
jgi:peptidyl-prolyl cis-trans isomerase SurA